MTEHNMKDLADFLWPDEARAAPRFYRHCPTCGDASETETICCSTAAAKPEWRLLRCPSCGCGFYEDQAIPDYSSEDRARGSTIYYAQQGAGLSVFIDILARIQKPPNSTYVEIGCGFGFGVDVAVNAMRWQGRGMDPGNLAKLGKQMLGVDIQTSYFNSTTVPDHSCDVVMASEVLEHLADPVAFLRDVHRSLRPDGVLALTTPDVQAIHRPIEKHALRATLSVGSHLILQSQASLSASLRTAGFLHQVVKTNGWRITAFASGVPMKLRDDPDDRQFQVTSYLVARADARASLDDLYFGYSGRAFFEAVSGAQWSLAQAVWTKLDPSLQTRYGIAVDEIEVPPPDAWTTPFHELHSVMPFNLPAIMLARAYLRLNLGQSRGAIMDRFKAIQTVCAPIWQKLLDGDIGDTLTEQILWVARAEELLCAAEMGERTVISMLAHLPESPSGSGYSSIVARATGALVAAGRPYIAARCAKAAQDGTQPTWPASVRLWKPFLRERRIMFGKWRRTLRL